MVHAEKYMMIMGGGGEPTGDKTIFDSTMKVLGENIKTSNWKYQTSFNGGHAETEKLMSAHFPTPSAQSNSFTPENYKKMIADYTAKINSGAINSGDQLMILINTHGAAKSTNEEKIHQIAASGGSGATNLNNLAGTKLVSLNDLGPLIELATGKGIKLGLVDLSCHSGNSQEFKKLYPKACIVTATGPKHYGFAGDSAFSGTFMKNLKKGVTLEGAFLKARAEANDASYPMISTDENNQIVAQIYSSMTPYLYYYDPTSDKLTDYILQASKDCITCTRETQFKTIIAQIEALQAATNGTKGSYNGDELKRLLQLYKDQQDEMIKSGIALGSENLNKQETFSSTLTIRGKKEPYVYKHTFSVREILLLNPGNTIATFERYRDKAKTPGEIAESQVVIDGFNKIKKRREEIIAQYPKLKDVETENANRVKQIGSNRETAEKIALQEKKFYDEMYRQKQSMNTEEPCRRIVF